MATIIAYDKVERHDVHKYTFKILAIGSDDENKEKFVKSNLVKNDQAVSTNLNEKVKESNNEASPNSTASSNAKDTLIESLMQKTDEMSSNFIKLQMKLEQKEAEFENEVKKVKDEVFNEGMEAGLKKAMKENENSLSSGLSQFSSSVGTLEESAKKFDAALESIKSELILAALDIAKEVIAVEISKNSSEIAKLLGDELIKDLQGASKITLKVNPKNHGVISEHVGSMEHIEVLSDSAVNEGGVIAISDIGNIDAQVLNRFEKVKKAALGE